MTAAAGMPLTLGAVALAAVLFLAALRLRSWPLWVGAYAVTVLALVFAWIGRVPRPWAG